MDDGVLSRKKAKVASQDSSRWTGLGGVPPLYCGKKVPVERRKLFHPSFRLERLKGGGVGGAALSDLRVVQGESEIPGEGTFKNAVQGGGKSSRTPTLFLRNQRKGGREDVQVADQFGPVGKNEGEKSGVRGRHCWMKGREVCSVEWSRDKNTGGAFLLKVHVNRKGKRKEDQKRTG